VYRRRNVERTASICTGEAATLSGPSFHSHAVETPPADLARRHDGQQIARLTEQLLTLGGQDQSAPDVGQRAAGPVRAEVRGFAERAGWVRFSREAALDTVPSSGTVTKVRSRLEIHGQSIRNPYGILKLQCIGRASSHGLLGSKRKQ